MSAVLKVRGVTLTALLFMVAGVLSGQPTERILIYGADQERPVLRRLGLHKRGYLGIELLELSPELRRHFAVPQGAGVMISRVERHSPADVAGLEVGDILMRLGGKLVGTAQQIRRLIAFQEDGSTVPMEIRRNGNVHQLEAILATRDRPQFDIGERLFELDGSRGPNGEFFFHLDAADGIWKAITVDGEAIRETLGRLGAHQQNEQLKSRVEELEERLKELSAELQRRQRAETPD